MKLARWGTALGALACVAASCDGRAPAAAGGGAARERAAVSAAPRGATLAGRVVDGEGRGLAGARVGVRERDASEASELVATSDASGAFRIEGVPWSDAQLSASHAELRAAVLVLGALRPGDERAGLELVLAPGASLGGRVWGSGGDAAGGALVWIESAREEPGRGDALSADADGRFLAAGLDDGPFRVTAWRSGAEREVASATGVAADTLDLEIFLAAPAALVLAVAGETPGDGLRAALRDAEGRPLESAPFPSDDVFRNVAELPWRARATAGGAELDGLAAGDYWVGLEDRARGRAGWTRVALRAGEHASVELALEPATLLRVDAPESLGPLIVRGPGGLPARLSAAGAKEAGRARFAALLPAGRYEIEGARESEPARSVTLSGEPELELRLD